jgi:hypothetical protein
MIVHLYIEGSMETDNTIYIVDKSFIPRWNGTASVWIPFAVNINCPYCGIRASFPLVKSYWDSLRKTMSASANCSSCGKTASFWIINPGDSSKNNEYGNGLVIMCPAPTRRAPVAGNELIPDSVSNVYQDCLEAYGAGIWSATATQCRVTLESILVQILPEEERKPGTPLAEQIKNLGTSVDFGKLFLSLSNALRKGGNIGAHFNPETRPSREIVDEMLDLIEYLMQYLFTLPKMIESLECRINPKKKSD